MEISRDNIIEILNNTGIHPSKDYGQNFLVEPSIADKIVQSLSLVEKDNVLEIGPGLGSLTHFLSMSSASITLVDIDFKMTDWLSVIYKDRANVKIITNDVRKLDVGEYSKVIGNLPYNITTELVSFLLMNARKCKKMVLMCQSETFEHFYQTKGSEYGPVSVLVHLLGEIKKILTVKAGSFVPAPKCASTVFEITIKDNIDYDYAIQVYKLSKSLFLNRRKTILNNFTNYLSNKELANQILSKCEVNPQLRPEEIAPEMYTKIYDMMKLLN